MRASPRPCRLQYGLWLPACRSAVPSQPGVRLDGAVPSLDRRLCSIEPRPNLLAYSASIRTAEGRCWHHPQLACTVGATCRRDHSTNTAGARERQTMRTLPGRITRRQCIDATATDGDPDHQAKSPSTVSRSARLYPTRRGGLVMCASPLGGVERGAHITHHGTPDEKSSQYGW